jgi:hypothetical protein
MRIRIRAEPIAAARGVGWYLFQRHKRGTMSEETIDSTKTFKVSRWGTIERSATARNEKPAGLGVKEQQIKGRTEVPVILPSHHTTAFNHPGIRLKTLQNTL